MSTNMKREPICYGRVATRTTVQEWYETETRDAGRRAKELRKLGYRVMVSPMGSQVTSVGRVRMTLVTIDHDYPTGGELPPQPARMEAL